MSDRDFNILFYLVLCFFILGVVFFAKIVFYEFFFDASLNHYCMICGQKYSLIILYVTSDSRDAFRGG